MTQILAKPVMPDGQTQATCASWSVVIFTPGTVTPVRVGTVQEPVDQVTCGDSFFGALLDASGDEHYCSWGWQTVESLLAHLECQYRLLTGALEFAE